MSALPGHYAPEPEFAPAAPMEDSEGMPLAQGRDESAGSASQPRPAAEVGAAGEHRKPRNIFQLLFGKTG